MFTSQITWQDDRHFRLKSHGGDENVEVSALLYLDQLLHSFCTTQLFNVSNLLLSSATSFYILLKIVLMGGVSTHVLLATEVSRHDIWKIYGYEMREQPLSFAITMYKKVIQLVIFFLILVHPYHWSVWTSCCINSVNLI